MCELPSRKERNPCPAAAHGKAQQLAQQLTDTNVVLNYVLHKSAMLASRLVNRAEHMAMQAHLTVTLTQKHIMQRHKLIGHFQSCSTVE